MKRVEMFQGTPRTMPEAVPLDGFMKKEKACAMSGVPYEMIAFGTVDVVFRREIQAVMVTVLGGKGENPTTATHKPRFKRPTPHAVAQRTSGSGVAKCSIIARLRGDGGQEGGAKDARWRPHRVTAKVRVPRSLHTQGCTHTIFATPRLFPMPTDCTHGHCGPLSPEGRCDSP